MINRTLKPLHALSSHPPAIHMIVFGKHLAILCSLILFGLLPTTGSAEVYKYIDKTGKVHYSDHPFTYLQKDFRQGDNSRVFMATDSGINKKQLIGLWDLTANSKHISNDTMEDAGKWQFKDDGSLTIQKGDSITHTQFRVQGKLIEINESDAWTAYRVVSLNDKNLSLKNEKGGIVYYFDKNNVIKEVVKVTKALYRRDQIKALVLYFTCMDIKYDALTPEEREYTNKDIFQATGIDHFDANVFLYSVDHYKNDPIFIEKYQPRINDEAKECKKTNVVPRFDVE